MGEVTSKSSAVTWWMKVPSDLVRIWTSSHKAYDNCTTILATDLPTAEHRNAATQAKHSNTADVCFHILGLIFTIIIQIVVYKLYLAGIIQIPLGELFPSTISDTLVTAFVCRHICISSSRWQNAQFIHVTNMAKATVSKSCQSWVDANLAFFILSKIHNSYPSIINFPP